ncbi:BamA/TamA family outer membrane protein [Pedobacter glucosidilyticus]|uniref:translocation and assembly module lipoprotein TamL n=1 Tax=Pedobacter glucosidilyticus TaxID=1122941 RepID=UPI0003FDEB6C|nr:BamA/TamA family outer membrane protein [Pedobacter glucosidilyticus]
MKAYIIYPVTILLLFTLILGACRSTKRLKENEALITKLNINGVDKEFEEQAESYVSLDIRPNSPFNLWVYNTFNKKGKKSLGEAPHLLDSSLVEVSRAQIQKFLNTKGFLNAKVESAIALQEKKASITFTAVQGPSFKFKDISFDIKNQDIKDLYLANRNKFTRITPGQRLDEDSIAYERDQVYTLMKKNGYYDFIRQYVRAEIDTNLNNSQANVTIEILNPDTTTHQQYTLNNTYIRIQPSTGIIKQGAQRNTSVIDSQYYFFDYSKFFKTSKVAPYIFLNKGEQYSIENVELTNQRLFELNVFKSVSVDFRKRPNSTELVGLIDIIPLKKKSNRIDGDYTFNSSITGANLGLTYQNRNIFGGAEILEIKLRGGLQFDKNLTGSISDRLLSRDYQIGASLTFPRLVTPFNLPFIGYSGIPRTRLGTNFQIYELKDRYLRRALGTNFTHDWVETKYKLHSLTPINIQYALGMIDPVVEQDLINRGYAFFLNTLRSQLVSSSIYNYTLNLARLSTLSNFTFFNGIVEVGGNTAALAAQAIGKSNTRGQKTLLGVPYYQFARLETDFRFYKYLGQEKQFVVRLNPGIGYSYGNVKSLPFDKQFFAGGSSGIRAWQARTLGPGNYNRSSLESDSTRLNLRNIDQLGDLKFEGNLEYRFKILDNFFGSKVKGATFVDFGNIWQLRDNGFEGAQIKFNKLWQQMAIGTGVGLRFDVSFFVFRLDAGFKVKDPQFRGADQWITKYYFDREAKKQLKATYADTNNPDRYSTTQIQFGIGMPF